MTTRTCSGAYCPRQEARCTGEAVYIWTGSHGGEYRLCALHCAEWRAQVRGIPPLEPIRIREQQPGPSTNPRYRAARDNHHPGAVGGHAPGSAERLGRRKDR
jgi:hypothetical protein